MLLSLDPETGDSYADVKRVVGFRVFLIPEAGCKGAPRVVKDEGGPIALAKAATDEDVLSLCEKLQLDLRGRRVMVKAYNSNAGILFERDVDLPETEDDEDDEEAPVLVTDAALLGMANALVESQKVMAATLRHMANLVGDVDEESDERAPPQNPLMEKLAGLLDGVDLQQVRERLTAAPVPVERAPNGKA